MVDSSALKVMVVFEAGSRLGCGSELTCLAASFFHKFFRTISLDNNHIDLYAIAAACLRLAHWHLCLHLGTTDLILVIANIAELPDEMLTQIAREKLTKTVDVVTTAVLINLNFQVDFRHSRQPTPGELSLASAQRLADLHERPVITRTQEEPLSFEIAEDEVELLMMRHSKDLISPHRYLVHYLNSLRVLLSEADEYGRSTLERISNLAWILLTDFFWSSKVLQIYANHIACATLMVSIEAFRLELQANPAEEQAARLWFLLNRKWNLIFCDDLNDVALKRIVQAIYRQYTDYNRGFELEFNTYLIEPTKTF